MNRPGYAHELRLRAIKLLGGECAVCGENDVDVLQIDHVSGKRDERDDHGSYLVRKLLQGRIDLGLLQLLCANCHARKSKSDYERWLVGQTT